MKIPVDIICLGPNSLSRWFPAFLFFFFKHGVPLLMFQKGKRLKLKNLVKKKT